LLDFINEIKKDLTRFGYWYVDDHATRPHYGRKLAVDP
jgi:hypothetical protein